MFYNTVMILGIKVGPQPQSFLDLETANPPFAEVWFNIEKKDEVYPELFAEMKKRSMQVGLHFWGRTTDGTWTNICHSDTELVHESMSLITETIDIAARNGFAYVNIHPSNRAKCRINFETHIIEPFTEPLPEDLSENIFIEHATKLHEYATARGVVLTVETAPPKETRDWTNPAGRGAAYDIYTLDNRMLMTLAQKGIAIANDFGHTVCSLTTNDRPSIMTYLTAMTRDLAPMTRLIHLGYVVPPYSGCDFHDHLDNPIFDTTAAIPNKQEMKQLLTQFKNRTDVWVLVEPNGRHPENYQFAKDLLATII